MGVVGVDVSGFGVQVNGIFQVEGSLCLMAHRL